MAAAVLIVEDQLLIACHLRDLIEEAGYVVTGIARDPAEALACAAQRRPDIALMDIWLQDETSGIDAARELYEHWGIRSLFLSANLDEEMRHEVEDYRPLGFVGKPFLNGEVVAALASAVHALDDNPTGP